MSKYKQSLEYAKRKAEERRQIEIIKQKAASLLVIKFIGVFDINSDLINYVKIAKEHNFNHLTLIDKYNKLITLDSSRIKQFYEEIIARLAEVNNEYYNLNRRLG